MKKLLKYDFYYLQKTSKFIIFPVLLVLLAIMSPLSAKYLNEILKAALEGSGIVMEFGEPTVFDSYMQYFGNVYEIYLYVIIFVAVGMFIGDKTKGLLPLILSKPINRTKYIFSKFISFGLLVLASLFIGYFVFDYYTYFLFDEVDMLGMFYSTLLYFIYIIYIMSMAMFAATHSKSYIVAVVITFGGMIFFGLLKILEPLIKVLEYLPGAILENIIKVLIADDHPLVRYGIKTYFEAYDDIYLVGEAENGREAIEICKKHLPDVVLMDVRMPELDGIETTVHILKKWPNVKVIILTSFIDKELMENSLKAGASSYLLKNEPGERIVRVIRDAYQGKSNLSSEVIQLMISEVRNPLSEKFQLTKREEEILSLMVEGLSNKEIADKTGLSIQTVKNHIYNIYRKAEVQSRMEFIQWIKLQASYTIKSKTGT